MTDLGTLPQSGPDSTSDSVLTSEAVPLTGTAPLPATAPPFDPKLRPAVEPVATDRIPVSFSGDGEGTAELTWGQREILQAMGRQGWISLGGVLPLPPGVTVQDAADRLRYMVSRFPSLRTRLRFESPGQPVQELHASGEIMLDVFDLAPGADAHETAAQIEGCYRTNPRDFRTQWPVQMGVLRRDGQLTHVIAVSCHTVSDGLGMQAMGREIDAGRTEPAIGLQQFALAEWQGSAAGQRVTAAAVRYMEKVLRSAPPRPLPISLDERDPRHWTGLLRSRALKLALPAIAERTAADTSSVLMALYAIALGRVGLLNPAVIRPLSSNRFRPGLTDVVGNLVQSGVCLLDASETTIDEVVRQARQVSMTVRKYSYFDPRAETALVERLHREALAQDPDAQPWSFLTWAFFNDRRVAPSGPAPSSRDELAEAGRQTTFSWFEKKENPYEPFFLHIDDAQDTGDPQEAGIELMVCADTRYTSPADNEAVAREMEAAAIEAAFDAEAPTHVKAPAPVEAVIRG